MVGIPTGQGTRHWVIPKTCKDHPLNTWRPAAFGDFRKKNAWTHVALLGNISAPVRATDLVEASKDVASLLVCTRKKIFAWGCGFFLSDVISGGLLAHLCPLCLALGANCLVGVFRWSFYWKLGYSPSLLILWMTCWGFGFKSCDVS